MAKPNYAFAKRQRDLAKKAKKEEKRLRKAQGGTGADEQEGQPEESQAVPGATEVEGSGDEAADPGAAPGGVEGEGPDRLAGSGPDQPDATGALDRRNA